MPVAPLVALITWFTTGIAPDRHNYLKVDIVPLYDKENRTLVSNNVSILKGAVK